MAEAGAAAAAIAQAIKASGAIVRVDDSTFQRLVARVDDPLVVTSQTTFFVTRYAYLTAYKGLVFYAKSKVPLRFPGRAEIIEAGAIWVPW
jgi:hypothetical protein